jgi:hypothetical protein
MERPASNGVSSVLAVPDEWLEEPARVRSYYNDDLPQLGNRPPAPPPARAARKCGTRARASRGRAVRVRGSRRSAAASRAAPSGDPDLGDEPPGDRRVAA